MASSSRPQGEGNSLVYVSFCELNVGYLFRSYLFHCLVRERIRTCIDHEVQGRGDDVTSSLMAAIEDSRIAIVLFSSLYAYPCWRLDGLAKIMERRMQGSLIVLPVFYMMRPDEVREQRGRFGEALAKHENKLGKDSNKLRRWREALSEAGSLSGWTFDADGDKSELVTRIIEKINDLLDCTTLYIAKHPVGIEARVEQIMELLDLGSDEVLMVGLWGMGGVGKTTLAKAVFNAIENQFEGCAFLPNVREAASHPAVGLPRLQQRLLSRVLQRNDLTILSVDIGKSLMKDRLCQKKVLLLLDDVSDRQQLDTLVGGPDWFGRGSRILVTTRGSFSLKVYNKHKVHKVETLPYSHALQLFSCYAFPQNHRNNIPMDLVDRCLDYAGGLPMALEVLGSLLQDRPEHHWRSTLDFVAGSLPKDIDQKLRVSFDELDYRAREIFLAIACLFMGGGRSHVDEVLDACGFEASLEIQLFIDKSLIMVTGPRERMEIHNLVLLMARNIIRVTHPNGPRTRDRLSAYEVVLNALSNHEDELEMVSDKANRSMEDFFDEVQSHNWDLDSDNDRGELVKRIARVKMDGMPREVNKLRKSYDVFLSFRGPDSRHTIISHLYPALCQKGVCTFKDNEKLEAGQSRSELFEAIEASRIAVVMFSENYASSKWCLDELTNIMERKEMNELIVVPIFYRVSPREVRLHKKENGKKGCYQAAMEDMKAKYGKDNPEMVERWKTALWKGGDLIGFSIGQGEDEGSVVRRVVERILNVLNRVTLEVAENPVGMATQLEKVKPLLCIYPHVDDVCMIGILGQGGVGKTTLSKAILTEYFRKFDDWCFLPNIREESKVPNGLALLQQKLLNKLLGQEDLIVGSVDEGKVLIKERLRHKKVLVILDDIDEYDQFGALAGNTNWFGNQSRIIITTRNRHVLPPNRVQHVHEVCLLNMDEAEELFRWHAFHGKDKNMEIDQHLVDRFLAYAARLPLALVVLGKFLRDRSASEWESTLKMLDNNPNIDINSVLKTSLDGLGREERQIFLDMSCFFKAWDREYVVKVLDSCGFATAIGIKILIERYLVTDEGDKFQIHDLIEVMGKSIIHDENSQDAGSRIWLYKDFIDVLSIEPVPNAVKGIVVLNSSKRPWDEKVNGSAFKGLYRLRILIIRNGFDVKGSLHLPRELRWFEWPGISMSTILFSDSSKLVALDLTDSNVKRIKGEAFKKLKYLNLCKCKSLDTFPNLSESSNLEDLNLYGCKSLTKLDGRVGSLENLVHLNLGECNNLAEVPSSLESSKLQTLNFLGCSKLIKLPDIKKQLQFLHELSIEQTAVKGLPDSIGNLVAVKILNLSLCTELTVIPRSIYKLQALVKLLAIGCSKLQRFPRNDAGNATEVLPNLAVLDFQYCNLKEADFLLDLTCFETLKEIRLSSNGFPHIPACISKFDNLEELWLCSCKHLVEVPELPNKVKLFITGCRMLESLPGYHAVIHRSSRSLNVDLSNCHSLKPCKIDSSLSLEVIRDFGGLVEAIVPGKAFPEWMVFQIADHHLNYEVRLPEDMSEDDILGLALSVTFNVAVLSRGEPNCDYSREVKFMIGEREDILISESDPWDGVHTWFIYLPRQSFANDINWSNMTFRFNPTGVTLESCGLRVVCKEERDDDKFEVREKEQKDETDWQSE